MDGLMDHLLPLSMHAGAGASPGRLVRSWIWKHGRSAWRSCGYERMPQVDGMGQFSMRGGILDIFPLTEELPVRIELWDTEVDSIRTFDLESQRSIEQLDEIDIYPATEMVLTKKEAEGGRGADSKRGEDLCGEAEITAMNTEEAHRITRNCKGTDGGHRGRLETDRTGCLDFVF